MRAAGVPHSLLLTLTWQSQGLLRLARVPLGVGKVHLGVGRVVLSPAQAQPPALMRLRGAGASFPV